MKILSVDDNVANLHLIEAIGKCNGHRVVSVRNGLEALDQLGIERFDLIVSDILMPGMDGFQLCRSVKGDARWSHIPFIFYTATYTAKHDQELALALGASRFIIKPTDPEEFLAAIEEVVHEGEGGQIPVPVPADLQSGETSGLYSHAVVRKLEKKIEQLEAARAELVAVIEQKNAEAVRRRVAENALKQSEEKFAKAFRWNPAATTIADLTTRLYLDVNEAFEQVTGYSRQEVVGQKWDELQLWSDASSRDKAVQYLLEVGTLRDWELGFRKKSGEIGTGLLSAILIDIDGRPCAVTATIDITERQRTTDALHKSEVKFSKVFQSNPAAMSIHEPDETGKIVDVNEAFEQLTGYRREQVLGRTAEDIGLLADPPERRNELQKLMRLGGSVRNFEHEFRRKGGDTGTGLLSIERFDIDAKQYAIATNVDITDRIRAQGEQAALLDQLRQAQKLESIGRLAGGVAHDFNNLLTVITGYSDFLINEISPTDPMRSWVDEIRRAAEHAQSLTHQLLAFSRKQVVAPKSVNLNSIVKDAERMLQRVIGEDIELTIRLDPKLEQTLADPNQMHQVIVNLAVNARDAMPDGGKLLIETRNVNPDERAAHEHRETASQQHVLLSVSDTGVGMPKEVLEKIFEPFFTTKERGKGTGLGLSTVYGIVEQSGGWIDVSSKLGDGTTFRIYLPICHASSVIQAVEIDHTTDASKGTETVLVLEDDDAIRRLTTTVLGRCGYHVLESASAAEAIQVAERYSGQIHLLLTDVILTDMNGKELSERLRISRPALRVLFTSGYSDDVIAPRGVLDSSVAYIAKPFSRDALLLKIREVLTGGASSREAEA